MEIHWNPIRNWKSIGIQSELGNPLESNCKLESDWIPIGSWIGKRFSSWKLDSKCT